MYTIKDLSEGKVAVKNDGTKQDLLKVLRLAFPNDLTFIPGSIYYYRDGNSPLFTKSNSTTLPDQSVKDFLINENIDRSDISQSIIDLIRNKVYTEPGIFQVVVRDELMEGDKRQSIINFLKNEDVSDFNVVTKKTTTTIHIKY